MSRSAWAVVARHWAELSRGSGPAGETDALLLERFRLRRDEASFAELVRRHGPMVLAACRRIIREPHTADDAFQAVFLVLARRAGSVRNPDRLGPWLHRVAVRISTRAARTARGRQTRELSYPEALAQAPALMATGLDPDQAALLHEEIDRLPDRDRLPIVLCDLQGLTHEQAAARLGWPVGTVKGRQSRARDRLRDRLARRGLTAPLTLITATLASDAKAVIPATLAAQTAAALVKFLLSGAAATTGSVAVTAAALTLAQGVRTTMWFSPLTLTALAALLGGGLIATQAPGPGGSASPANPSAALTLAQTPAGAERSSLKDGNDGPGPSGGAGRPEPSQEPGAFLTDAEELTLVEARAGAEAEALLLEDDLELIRDEVMERKREVRQLASYASLKTEKRKLSDGDRDGLARYETRSTDLARLMNEYKETLARQQVLRAQQRQIDQKLRQPRASATQFKPGDWLQIEVLQGLPGRPLRGERQIRPDGTISLGFYGDLFVSGLSRRQVKEKLIQHLRRWLSEEDLGLVGTDASGQPYRLTPYESDRVLVAEAETLSRSSSRSDPEPPSDASRRAPSEAPREASPR